MTQDWLADAARRVPDRDALVVGGEALTFAQLDRRASALASWLEGRGVGAGSRVATLLSNGPTAAILPHAMLRLGAVLVPLNTRLSEAEVEWQLEHSHPTLVLREEVSPRLSTPGSRPSAERRELQPFAVIHTSGTTGRPKGAVLTVANFLHSARASSAVLGVRDDDRWLAVLPLFHVGGLSILLRSALQATCVVVHERFDAAAVNRAIEREGVTIVSLVSVMLQRMLDAREDRPFPPSFRCALVGGGPVPAPLLERCARAGVPVAQTYGLTEATSQVTTLPPAESPRKPGSAGRPLPGVEVRLDGGSEGEILVRGPTVMLGYLDDPGATAAALRDGWLHTGDVGRLDEEGYLYVLDRRDDLIVTGGENVYPAEVEAALLAHPSVEEAAVLGVPDEAWGQRVVAVVRLRGEEPATAASLEAHARGMLAGYKVPREVRFTREALPRTASGKLRRSTLREQFE